MKALRPTLSVTLPSFGPLGATEGWHRLLDLAKLADSAGVDRILLTDHVVMGRNTDRYRWGEFPFEPDVDWLEPLTTLSAIAGATQRVRLSTKVLIAPLRPAPLLAKMLATLDALSQGRLEIGVATGWQREEYDAQGLDWSKRGQLLDDTMAACKVLWSESPASFDSASIRFQDIWCEPKPVQVGGIPIWFGGGLHARNVARICRLGDGWIPAPYATVEAVRYGGETLRAAFSEAGRDPATLQVQGDLDAVLGANGRPDLEVSLARVPEWWRAGATTVNVVMPLFVGKLERAPAFFEALAAGFEKVTA